MNLIKYYFALILGLLLFIGLYALAVSLFWNPLGAWSCVSLSLAFIIVLAVFISQLIDVAPIANKEIFKLVLKSDLEKSTKDAD